MATAILAATAGAIVSSFLKPWADQAFSLAQKRISMLYGVKEDLEMLSDNLLSIERVLEDAEEKQCTKAAIKRWLEEFKVAAYDAEDLLDEMATEDGLRSWGTEAGNAGSTRRVSGCLLPSYFSCLSGANFKYKTGRWVREINLKLEKLEKRAKELGLEEVPRKEQNVSMRETTSSLEKNVFGREEEREAIIKQLLSSDDMPETSSTRRGGGGEVSLIPIVGMGGIGKTTLAQMVFNDERVQGHYISKTWICVSENFDVHRLIAEIIGESQSQSSLENLKNKLKEKLNNGKFLIVLDDVWCENQQEWKKLWDPLNQDGLGGTVIVTTRSEKVPNSVFPIQSNHLKPMPDGDCWLIFEKWAFVNGSSEDYPDLKGVGLQIVKKLKGIPLAAKLVAGFLCNILEVNYWRSLLDRNIWPLGDENDILPILRLSYQHLPAQLKRCFAYCSLFPKDWAFDRAMLIRMWMAQGFIPSDGNQRMEDVGNLYFNNLLQRSFFQCMDGSYLMHDLIHDLAESVSRGECLRLGENDTDVRPGTVRHVSSVKGATQINIEKFGRSHSFLCLQSLTFHPIVCRMKFVRILIFGRVFSEDQKFLDGIGDLRHLRYLEILGFIRLPESICRLYNLQTLVISYDTRLPRGVSKLANLRHLIAQPPYMNVARISGVGRLTSLQELKKFEVLDVRGHMIRELQHMNQLRGELSIVGLENVKSREEAMQADLKAKVHLDSLELSWTGAAVRRGVDNDEVIDALEPPPDILKLAVTGHQGTRPALWMQGQATLISNLTSLRLENCHSWEQLPPMEQMRQLKHLCISGMHRVKRVEWKEEMDAVLFPSLETLKFGIMPGLEEWAVLRPGDDHAAGDRHGFPSLRKLDVHDCLKLRTLPCFVSGPWTKLVISGYRMSSGPFQSDTIGLSVVNCPVLLSKLPSFPAHYLEVVESLTIVDREVLPTFTEENWVRLQRRSSLRKLLIERCRNIDHLPTYLSSFSSLQELHIYDSGSIQSLGISSCPGNQSPPPDNSLPPSSIRKLTLKDCQGLQSLPDDLHLLSSLEELEIRRCPRLRVLPENGLPPSLGKLEIRSCRGLQSLSANAHMRSSEELGMMILDNNGLPPSLTTLVIHKCRGLQSLPANMHLLTSLQELSISCCPQIQSLPGDGLPPSLKKLCINRCPELQERCREEVGLDWPKIAHLPKDSVLDGGSPADSYDDIDLW